MKTCKNLTKENPVDEFICSECGFMTNDFSRLEIDEDFEEGIYYEERNHHEFEIKYCPNCGAKVVEE